jgi:hypothetical protein
MFLTINLSAISAFVKRPIEVREVYCADLDLTIRGHFEPGSAGPFARLNDEQLAFLRLFVTSRGNLSDIERSLGVSYPTVRSKLDDLIATLTETEGEQTDGGSPGPSRSEILAQISQGRLSVEEGMAMLHSLPEDAG